MIGLKNSFDASFATKCNYLRSIKTIKQGKDILFCIILKDISPTVSILDNES